MIKTFSNKWLQVRITLIGCFFTLLFGAIIIRAYQLQMIEQDMLKEMHLRSAHKNRKASPQTGNYL